MKKLVTAFAACMIAGLVSAQVESQNVVGYNTVTIRNGYNMFSLNLDKVGDVDVGISIQDLIPGTTAGLVKGTGSPSADNIMVYDAVGKTYATYFLYYNAKTTTHGSNNKWCNNATTNVATKTFANGEAFWYLSRTNLNAQVPFAGQVPFEASKASTIYSGYNMIGGAFSADFNANELGSTYWATCGAVKGTGSPSADNIMVYDAAGKVYSTYFLYYNAKTTTHGSNNKWCVNATTNVATGVMVPMGQGAWYLCRTNTNWSLTLTKPYTL